MTISNLDLADEKHSAQFKKKFCWFDHVIRMHVVPTIRLLFVIWTNAPFLLHIIEA